MTEQILDKMEELIDVPMTYKQLCESFDEKYYTGGKAKVAQIKEWQLFCDLEITNKPTRYIIHAVYRNNLECYEQMERRRDLQPLFDATLYEWIKSNHYSTIYASYPEILKALSIVNENFPYMLDINNMKALGKQYEIYPNIAQDAYRILKEWARRTLAKSAQRATILVRYAFRLIRVTYDVDGVVYRTKADAPLGSKLEQQCQAIYAQAAQEVMPEHWDILESETQSWVSQEKYAKFNARMTQLVQEKFNGEYDHLTVIRAICPAEQEWIDTELENIYKNQLPEIQINAESCRKIFASTQFDKINEYGYLCILPNNTKRDFINLGIKIPPEFSIKNKLKEIREEQAILKSLE